MKRFPLCLTALVLFAACATAPRIDPALPAAATADLPETTDELIHLADQSHSQWPPKKDRTWRGWAALKKAQTQSEPSYALSWRLARGGYLLSDLLQKDKQREQYAQQGAEAADKAIGLDSTRVEGHYYLALNLGHLAEVTTDLRLVKEMVRVAQKAAEITPEYDDAGPVLLLGKTYLSAPAWPVSVGDVEQAVDYLERAVKIAPTPLAQLFLGQAYVAVERYPEAVDQLRSALSATGPTALDNKWRQEGQAALTEVEAELQ